MTVRIYRAVITQQKSYLAPCRNSLDKILKIRVGPKDDVQAHFICVPIFILESANLKTRDTNS